MLLSQTTSPTEKVSIQLLSGPLIFSVIIHTENQGGATTHRHFITAT